MPAPIKASTQQFLDIKDIRDDLVILKDGSVCLIIQVQAVNFDLLSEKEQEALIYAYSGLINSLSFPVQIFIHSQKKDISSYLELLEQTLIKQTSENIKTQIKKYQQFIKETVKKNEVLDKKFYLVIPFSRFELGFKNLNTNLSQTVKRAQTALYPKRDHLLRQLNRLGLIGASLNTEQLVRLFYRLYNPDASGSQRITFGQEYQQVMMGINEEPTNKT